MTNLRFFYIFLLFSCAPEVIKLTIPKDIPPNEIPKFCFQQLKNQKSFCFNLCFKTDTPAPFEAKFKGIVILPNQEERIGNWQRLGEKVFTHIKGIGDFQYEKHEAGWEIHPRGEESNILIQLERILLFSEFECEFKGLKQISFSFKPNLIFLDPAQSKPMKGLLIIDRVNLLPLKIIVSDSARTTFWEIRFFGYNRKNKITQPFIPKVNIQLISESKLDDKTKTVLLDRFQRLGFQARIKAFSSKPRPTLEIQLEKDIPEVQLKLIVSQGLIKIYSGEWLEAKTIISDTELKYFQFKPAKLRKLIFTNQDIERAEANLTQGPEPILELYLKTQWKLERKEELLFLLFNDEIIGYTKVSQNQLIDKLQFKEIGDLIKTTTFAAIINSGVIKPVLKFLPKE